MKTFFKIYIFDIIKMKLSKKTKIKILIQILFERIQKILGLPFLILELLFIVLEKIRNINNFIIDLFYNNTIALLNQEEFKQLQQELKRLFQKDKILKKEDIK